MLLFDRFDMVCCMVLMMSCYSYAFVFLLVVVVPVAPSVYILCKWIVCQCEAVDVFVIESELVSG